MPETRWSHRGLTADGLPIQEDDAMLPPPPTQTANLPPPSSRPKRQKSKLSKELRKYVASIPKLSKETVQAFHSGQLDGAELTQAVVTDIEKKKSRAALVASTNAERARASPGVRGSSSTQIPREVSVPMQMDAPMPTMSRRSHQDTYIEPVHSVRHSMALETVAEVDEISPQKSEKRASSRSNSRVVTPTPTPPTAPVHQHVQQMQPQHHVQQQQVMQQPPSPAPMQQPIQQQMQQYHEVSISEERGVSESPDTEKDTVYAVSIHVPPVVQAFLNWAQRRKRTILSLLAILLGLQLLLKSDRAKKFLAAFFGRKRK